MENPKKESAYKMAFWSYVGLLITTIHLIIKTHLL